MPDDKRNRPDQPQGGDQDRDRQKERKPGGGTMEPPENRPRREENEEQE
jgi:hypothetical protein